MIFGNRVAKMKLVEQLTLVTFQTAHHGSTSPRFASTQRNHASWSVSTDFCNKIGTKRTLPSVLLLSAFDPKAAMPTVSSSQSERCRTDNRRGSQLKQSAKDLLVGTWLQVS